MIAVLSAGIGWMSSRSVFMHAPADHDTRRRSGGTNPRCRLSSAVCDIPGRKFQRRTGMRKQFVLAVLVSSVALASARAEAADRITPPAVPGNLQVGDNAKAFLMGDAYGTQNYVCLPSSTSPTGFAWTLFGPQATLFNDDDEQIITHFLSPNPVESDTPRASWRHSRDSSTVWAVMTQSSS